MLREQAKFFWDDAWGPNPLGSGPTSTSQASAVIGVPTAPQAGTPASIPAAPQAVTLSSSAPAASQADGTHVFSDASSDAGTAEAAALQSLNHSHASDSLPFSAPAAESDGGQGGGFDIAAGDFSADWFVV